MNKDIRLATSFKGHRKRKRLRRFLGDRSDSYLIDLWLTVAMDCPEGVLLGWDKMDIADACGWEGDPEELVSALIESNWLEKDSDANYIIHDWCEHQGWACKAKSRSEAASKNILLRWALRETKKENTPDFKKWFKSEYVYQNGHTTNNILSYYESYTNGNTPSPSPSPSPLPIPSLTKKKAEKIYSSYLDLVAPGKKSKQRAVKNIVKWLKKGRDDNDLIQAIQNYASGCSPDPTYRKDPANFFGVNEDFAFDYMPENYTPPKKQSLAQKAF
jgi:hypothetical protein